MASEDPQPMDSGRGSSEDLAMHAGGKLGYLRIELPRPGLGTGNSSPKNPAGDGGRTHAKLLA